MMQCSIGGKLAQRFVSPLGQIDPNDTKTAGIHTKISLQLPLLRCPRDSERSFTSTGFQYFSLASGVSAIAGSRSQKLSASRGANAIIGNLDLPESVRFVRSNPRKLWQGRHFWEARPGSSVSWFTKAARPSSGPLVFWIIRSHYSDPPSIRDHCRGLPLPSRPLHPSARRWTRCPRDHNAGLGGVFS
jgi:hypothetical protein